MGHLPADGDAPDVRTGTHGADGCTHRRTGAGRDKPPLHRGDDAPGGRDIPAGRTEVQHRLAPSGGRNPLRRAPTGFQGQEDEDRTIRYRRGSAGGPAPQARGGRQDTGAQRIEETAGHIHRCPAQTGQCLHGTHTHHLQPNRHHHGTPVLLQPQPAEHPRARCHGQGGAQGLHPRRGTTLLLGRLQPDRTTHHGTPQQGRESGAGLPLRRGHTCRHGSQDIPQGHQRGYLRRAPACQDGQFRHHLRHQCLWPGRAPRMLQKRSKATHRRLFPNLSRCEGIHGAEHSHGTREGLHRDHLPPPLSPARHKQPQCRGTRLCRAQCHQLAHTGQCRRHHEDSHDTCGPPHAPRRPPQPHDSSGARRTELQCPARRARPTPAPRHRGDAECRLAHSPPHSRCRVGHKLAGGALKKLGTDRFAQTRQFVYEAN